MTKLLEWICACCTFSAIYLALITNQFNSSLIETWMLPIKLLPVVLIGLFGIYSLVTILHRVITFNDCPEAASELQKQIKEAKADLKLKGFKFVE